MFEGALNPMHIMIVLGIALIVFGPKRIPELAKTVGTGVRELKDSLAGHDQAPPQPTALAAAAAPAEPVEVTTDAPEAASAPRS